VHAVHGIILIVIVTPDSVTACELKGVAVGRLLTLPVLLLRRPTFADPTAADADSPQDGFLSCAKQPQLEDPCHKRAAEAAPSGLQQHQRRGGAMGRKEFISDGLRLDGRRPKELRRMRSQIGVLQSADGSAMFQMGNTQVRLCAQGGYLRDVAAAEPGCYTGLAPAQLIDVYVCACVCRRVCACMRAVCVRACVRGELISSAPARTCACGCTCACVKAAVCRCCGSTGSSPAAAVTLSSVAGAHLWRRPFRHALTANQRLTLDRPCVPPLRPRNSALPHTASLPPPLPHDPRCWRLCLGRARWRCGRS
jgi:hypothetical protein